ncbi:MAG: glycosyltransferase family 4 protein [Candidatus Omnitrophica bacterium]|nr:glycosyltransferase family 4 protein [Candidatus Omnitrophota bacterium]
MRIGFDAASLTRERSGIANYLVRLVRRLVEIDGDLQVVLFAPDKICVDYDLFIHHPRVKRVIVDLPRAEQKKWVRKYLPKLLKEYDINLFHQPGGLDTSVFRPSCPCVVTAHDMAPWVLNTFKDLRKAIRYKVRTTLWAHQAKRIVTGVDVSRNDIVRLCRVSADKVIVSPYGAERVYEGDITADEENDILRKYRLQGKRYVINCSGLNFKRRNLDLVLDGFARFQREVTGEVTLVFTGAIANVQGAFDRAQRKMGMLGIRERVVTTGFMAEKSLQVLLNNAEAVIITSFCEGFPQSMVEAFASGTAVIATDRGGVPEVAGEAAVIIDPYDPQALSEALKRLTGNEVEKHLYAEKGHTRAQDFTWQRHAQDVIAVYRSLVK